MRVRPSARLLVLDPENRVLLFRFAFKRGALEGTSFWATPGGGVDPNETFEDAAIRELREETGLIIAHPGDPVATREAVFEGPEGETIFADERYFLIHVAQAIVVSDGWTALEKEVMTEHRWWTLEEIERSDEQIWPETLLDILARVGAGVENPPCLKPETIVAGSAPILVAAGSLDRSSKRAQLSLTGRPNRENSLSNQTQSRLNRVTMTQVKL